MSGFRAPTQVEVAEVVRRIPTLQLRRAFFEGLRNPLWLEPLAEAGMFSNPPEPERTDDGMVRDLYWPEIEYLIRIAPDAPALVVDILLKLEKSNNAWVRRGVFSIGAVIPAREAARFKPLLKVWRPTGFGWRSDPKEMVDFVVNLVTGGEFKRGVWVANALFRPSSPERATRSGVLLEDYWYETALPRVAEALGDNGLNVVLPWLEAYERVDGNFTDGYDRKHLSRESIRASSAPDGDESVEQVLITAVCDLAADAMVREPRSTLPRLLRSRMVLVRKIALYAVGEALSRPGLSSGQVDDLVTVAVELLSDTESRTSECRIEYGELARAVARYSRKALDPLAEIFAAGPGVDLDALRVWVRRDDETEDELEERVQESLDHRRHLWLSTIGAEALPAGLQSVLADLDARFDVIDEPLAPINVVTSWSGPNSPITQDDMAAMSPTALAAHLESWHPSGDGWGPEPSHEGQARELTGLVTTNPNVLVGADDLVDRLRPNYLRSIVEGWEAALKAGIAPNWDQVIDVIRRILAHGDESSFPQEGDRFDDDPDFRGAKHAVVRLLADLVKKRDESLVPAEALPIFADLLIHEAGDEAAWRDYANYDRDSGWDPLSIALNWQWPIAIHGLLNLISRGKDTPWYAAAQSALERELARNDERGAGSAVIGQSLGRLMGADSEWVEQRTPEWFGTADGVTRSQQVAITTALAVHYFHPRLYDLLSPSIIAAINSTEPLVPGWRGRSEPLDVIGQWVIWSLIRDHTTMDDPVAATFYESAGPKTRGDAIGSIAWSFMHAESVDEAIRDRLGELWDARVEHVRAQRDDREELSKFYWFAKSGKFAPTWWLPRFKEAVRLCPELAGERYMISTQLADAADSDPRGALDTAELLIEERGKTGMPVWDLERNAVPTVIARAIASGNEQLKHDAIVFMNRLGERGHADLEKQVNDLLEGKPLSDD